MALSLLQLGLLLLGLGGTAAVLQQQRNKRAELEDLQRSMRRVAAAVLESTRVQEQLDRLRLLQRAAEQGVHLGASTVREVHMGIASIPFGILEAIPVTRHPTRIVRGIHDQISGAVYQGITGGNKLLGSALRLNLKQRAQDSGKDGGKDAPEADREPGEKP